MEERLQFVRDDLSDRFTMSELCARYGVSRRIGYKWLARYDTDGRHGLVDRSRAPHHCPHKIAPRLAELLVTAREVHPYWGARKLLTILAKKHPRIESWPAPSTVADRLARRGLVQQRRRRRSPVHPGLVRPDTAAPNDLWSADFKGQFRTGDGRYCFPLTIADQHTRFLLTCHGVLSTQTVTARPVFERAFREYGLPLAIRTDNCVPFATQAIHGLSYLNVWWMRLGILHQRIRPGEIQQPLMEAEGSAGGDLFTLKCPDTRGPGAGRSRPADAITSSPANRSVTYVPGHFCYPSARPFSDGAR